MFQVSCFKCCSHLNPETWNLAKRKCLSATQSAVSSVTVGLGDLMSVTLLAHVDESRVDDELVEVDLWLSDNESEGLDEQLS